MLRPSEAFRLGLSVTRPSGLGFPRFVYTLSKPSGLRVTRASRPAKSRVILLLRNFSSFAKPYRPVVLFTRPGRSGYLLFLQGGTPWLLSGRGRPSLGHGHAHGLGHERTYARFTPYIMSIFSSCLTHNKQTIAF